MKKNYIIQAHKSPLQVKRLISILDDSSSNFTIHIDAKTDIEPFEKLIIGENILFIKERLNCVWGDYSQVLVTLKLIESVLENSCEGRVILISGQDYPIKSNSEITEFFDANSNDYMHFDSYKEPISKKNGAFYQRLTHYKINCSDKKGDFVILPPVFKSNRNELKEYIRLLYYKKVSIFQIFSLCRVREAKFCNNKHYRGSQWWSLHISSVKKIYDYYLVHKREIDNFYKKSFCSDEQFFQTLYRHVMPKNEVSDYLHYIDWERSGVQLPVIFGANDFGLLVEQSGNKLFARKFDIDVDAKILDLMDNHFLHSVLN